MEWKMYHKDRDGKIVATGMKMVLEERGVSTAGKGGDLMCKTLGQHSDFKDEKNMIEHMLIERAQQQSSTQSRECGLN